MKDKMIEKKKERDAQRKELKTDIEKTAEAIRKSIGEKAFMMDKKKEIDTQKHQIKADVKGIGEKLESEIEKIEQKKIDENK